MTRRRGRGGVLAEARGARAGGAGGVLVALVWMVIALFYASSIDGQAFTARERIPTEGMPRHPTLAIAGDGSIVTAWDEGANGTRRVAFGRATADRAGGMTFTRTVVSGREAAVYPVVAVAGRATVMACTTGAGAASTIRVARIP